ncbi:hypothetical protein [Albidovulum sediminis]|uniref:DUF1127 domain-containing protein n=1 Tax=Albidovulum sediminis TaxID=3066345 RepID=A0ABT2NIT7_9RHOB|nr:hypothetical protein [Defluviimonas sediminis]MCT8328836.1 hypothetical protein [Defluviimonas sediminis]
MLRHLATRWRASFQARDQRRVVADLPAHLLRDIGLGDAVGQPDVLRAVLRGGG